MNDQAEPEGLLVRATVHCAGGIYPGWVGWVSADSPWVKENLGKTLFPVEDEPTIEDEPVDPEPVEQEIRNESGEVIGGYVSLETGDDRDA